jgi:flagellar biosynthesis/type III secretory pathway M-ring protein FliF/YscJ
MSAKHHTRSVRRIWMVRVVVIVVFVVLDALVRPAAAPVRQRNVWESSFIVHGRANQALLLKRLL